MYLEFLYFSFNHIYFKYDKYGFFWIFVLNSYELLRPPKHVEFFGLSFEAYNLIYSYFFNYVDNWYVYFIWLGVVTLFFSVLNILSTVFNIMMINYNSMGYFFIGNIQFLLCMLLFLFMWILKYYFYGGFVFICLFLFVLLFVYVIFFFGFRGIFNIDLNALVCYFVNEVWFLLCMLLFLFMWILKYYFYGGFVFICLFLFVLLFVYVVFFSLDYSIVVCDNERKFVYENFFAFCSGFYDIRFFYFYFQNFCSSFVFFAFYVYLHENFLIYFYCYHFIFYTMIKFYFNNIFVYFSSNFMYDLILNSGFFQHQFVHLLQHNFIQFYSSYIDVDYFYNMPVFMWVYTVNNNFIFFNNMNFLLVGSLYFVSYYFNLFVLLLLLVCSQIIVYLHYYIYVLIGNYFSSMYSAFGNVWFMLVFRKCICILVMCGSLCIMYI